MFKVLCNIQFYYTRDLRFNNEGDFMRKLFFSWSFAVFLSSSGLVSAHCQMPCGIYHDDMVFDQVDQYAETMYKGITVMNESKFSSVKDKNEFVRWVIQKENETNEVANLLLTYFIQQKIKPGEEDTLKKLTSVHKLLFLLVQIKQNADVGIVESFTSEWEKFKLMFHREGYECEMEKIKMKKIEQDEKAAKEAEKPLKAVKNAAH